MNDKILKPYETDASGIKGKALDVVFPKTIQELRSAVVLNQKLTIRGGGTGLAGGAVPQNDVVIDLSKLTHITNLDKERKTIEVGAGVILDELQGFIARYGLEFPVNPSSHAICTIGGMIATNAEGSRAIKYGKTSRWINWIEIMDSKGGLYKKTTTEISDYAGMEGITGIITRASLKLINKRPRTASLISSDSIQEIINITRNLKRHPNISMIEFLDKQVSTLLDLGEKHHLIIEFESEEGELTGKDYQELLDLRDKVYPLLAKNKYIRIEDPKLLLDRFEKFYLWLESKNIPVFGHLSVGIIHPHFKEGQESLIKEMMSIVRRLHGQISGEHGIGLTKKDFVDPNDKKILINIKKRTDPENKFNPGKVI